jgi:hypothetical protein
VDGVQKRVIPFAGTDREGEFCQMGVGIILPKEKTSSIWGLLGPHNLIASYRGMKIAQEMPDIGYGTLCACWYAGRENPSPFDDKYVKEVESAIGAEKRKAILNEPLPDLDPVIKLMEEKGIDFDAGDLQAEIENGRLQPTETVRRVIDKFSDDVLVFRGLSGDYRTCYEHLTEKGSGRILKLALGDGYAFWRGEESKLADDYVRAASKLVDRELPSFREGVGRIQSDFKSLDEKLDSLDGEGYQSLRETFEKGLKHSDSLIEFAGATLQKLEEAKKNSEDSKVKFVSYHDGFNGLGRTFSDMRLQFSSLSRWDGTKQKGVKRNKQVYDTMSDEASSLLVELNRSLREQMPGMYSLTSA